MKQQIIQNDEFKITKPSVIVYRLCSFPIIVYSTDKADQDWINDTIKLIQLTIHLFNMEFLKTDRIFHFKNKFELLDDFTISTEEGTSNYFIDLSIKDNIIPMKEWLINFSEYLTLKLK